MKVQPLNQSYVYQGQQGYGQPIYGQQQQYGYQPQPVYYQQQPSVIVYQQQPQQVQVSYREEVVVRARRRRFSSSGVCWVIILLLVFWPLFWLPFVMEDCYEYY